ncbi:MAG: MIP/aquaporin family protein [Actinomycetota bacterium]
MTCDLHPPLWRRTLGEFVGTALLLTAVVGSGISAHRLSPGNVGLELLENALATAFALVAIILAMGAVSGAHLNPIITLVDRYLGGVSTRDTLAYCCAQTLGAGAGVMVANVMFSLPFVHISTRIRSGGGQWLGEVVATFGLVLIVVGMARSRRTVATPFAVGLYIGAAYFFTSSTSFANPAVTLGRTLTDTFAGIAPRSAPAFLLAQIAGGVLGVVVAKALYPTSSAVVEDELIAPDVDR